MVTLIFLAGGTGSRMDSTVPKQYLMLRGKPIALHSFYTLSCMPQITQIVVVCHEEYQHFFSNCQFAKPGARRQDSVYSGFIQSTSDLILIHDSARPFIETQYIPPLLEAVSRTGAATLATPVTSTIKQCGPNHIVEKTLNRTHLWDIQTPQALQRDLLKDSFDYVHRHKIEVTDDVSLAEAIGHPVEIVPSSPRNFKITNPFDLIVAQSICAIN